MTDHDKKMQQMQDMLQGAINQRNAAQNECLSLSSNLREAQRAQETLAAELDNAQRKIADLTAALEAHTKNLEDNTADDNPAMSTPKANGHAEEMSAA